MTVWPLLSVAVKVALVAVDTVALPNWVAPTLAREGIDFVLDPMWSTIRPDLHEHIDGLRSVCPKPGKTVNVASDAH